MTIRWRNIQDIYEFMETGNPKMRLRCFAFCELLDMNRRICA
jgi:hypothetical protein